MTARASEGFSVALCTYNGATHLAEQLDSIAAQTHAPAELVVCDDGSSDATWRLLEEFAARAPFSVRLYRNAENLGSTKNFERAISLCRHELIALSDQDDVWLPDKLARIASRFAASPRVGLVFTDAEVVDEKLRPLGVRLWEAVGFGETEQRLVRRGRALDVLLPGWTVTGATMAFRAEFNSLALEIPEDLGIIHDGWIALVVAAVAEVDFIAEPLIKYRQHARQQIGAPEKGAAEKGAAAAQGLGGMTEAARRRNDYEDLIRIGERASARLQERRGFVPGDRTLRGLEARLAHLRTRATLPDSKLRRVGCVLRELLTRRYHLYSNGTRSAVKDLLFRG